MYVSCIQNFKKETFTAKKNIFCISTNMSCAYLVYKQFLNDIFYIKYKIYNIIVL